MTGHSHQKHHGGNPSQRCLHHHQKKASHHCHLSHQSHQKKAPAHTKAIPPGVPAAFQNVSQKDSSKASNPNLSQYQTGWKAKVCWFLVAHTTNQQVECDYIMEQWTFHPPQQHQVSQGGWAAKAKELLDAHQAKATQRGCQFGGMATWQLCFHILAPCRFCLATCANITFQICPLSLSGMPEIHT